MTHPRRPLKPGIVLLSVAELPEAYFPFTIEFFKISDREVVRTLTIESPGNFYIPPVAREIGEPCGIRVIYPNGSVVVHKPNEVELRSFLHGR